MPFLDLFFPQVCPLCGVNVKTKEPSFPLCFFCDQNMPYHPLLSVLDDLNIFSIIFYDSLTRELIKQYKYDNIKVLGKYFSKKICKFLGKDIKKQGIDIIIPLPIHKSRLNERGYNQSDILSKHISKSLGIKENNKILKKIKNTVSQTGLSRKQRLENPCGSFGLNDISFLKNYSHALIIDDIYTTGASTKECIKVLKNAKRDLKVSVLVIARNLG